jgi:hypothetical protein
MAACVFEDTVLTSIYRQTTNSIQQTQSSSFETMSHRCQFNFHVNSIQMDSTTLLRNHELIKKRQFNRSNTYSCKNDLTNIANDNSCSTQSVSIKNNNESMKRLLSYFLELNYFVSI